MTPLTGDLMAMISRFIEEVWNKGNLGPLVVLLLGEQRGDRAVPA